VTCRLAQATPAITPRSGLWPGLPGAAAQDKLLFGTDVLRPDQNLPLLTYLRASSISDTAREKIVHGNAERLLRF